MNEQKQVSSNWEKRHVLVGVTGGIAAYKVADLVSRLRKDGAEVRVVMTRAATNFVTPRVLQELSGHEVQIDLFADATGGVPHVQMGQEADLLIVAPASADFLGKMAHGLADDLLSTTILATSSPVVVAPAMNSVMYLNPAVQENLATLRRRGYRIIPPDEGWLACGMTGPGRLPAVDVILAEAAAVLAEKEAPRDLDGIQVLITAGPTREWVDAVRFLSNASSGKMGYALAAAAQKRGAKVVLVSGPVTLEPPAGVEVVRVQSAEDMFNAVKERQAWARVIIKAAAVADWRPAENIPGKMKKNGQGMTLEMVPNPDILRYLGEHRHPGQILVGFAAESGQPVAEARRKLQEKQVDLIVANDVSLPGSGFDVDTNKAWLARAGGEVEELPLLRKDELAEKILDEVTVLLEGRRGR